MFLVLLACAPSPDDSSVTGPTFNPEPPTEIGGDRPAAVQLPDPYTIERDWPIVVLLHGYGVTSEIQELVFQLGQHVDTLGFVLIKPEGTVDRNGSQFWNATEECCDFDGSGVDDVGYLTGLIDEARSLYPVSRVSFVGHSNGGYMSYRMACEVPERIDKIAVLAGAVYNDEADCIGTGAVSVLHVHGTNDDSVAYESTPTHAGAEESVGRWVSRAGCETTPAELDARDYLSQVDGVETTVAQWSGCDDGLDMQLWSAVEGDHTFFPNQQEFKDDLATWAVATEP